MRIHWFQHVPYEGLGMIAQWVAEEKHELTCTRWYAGELPPGPDAYDWLIVMGGPMNVDEHGEFPWLEAEKAAIAAAIAAGRRVLGICLGAQLIARALGAEVRPNGESELGWSSVHRTEEAGEHPLLGIFPTCFEAFHWHGDRFELPEPSVPLGHSNGCAHQGFAVGDRVVGLQFHLELRAGDITELGSQGYLEHEPGEYVDPPGKIVEQSPYAAPISRKLMTALLERMAAAD
ncbi:MAG: type 1 glutamine amidotransferase [Verrucomicrobiota bacterium]